MQPARSSSIANTLRKAMKTGASLEIWTAPGFQELRPDRTFPNGYEGVQHRQATQALQPHREAPQETPKHLPRPDQNPNSDTPF